MFVDFLTTYTSPPYYVHTIECKVICCVDAPGVKKINACSKVFVECIICFGELDETSFASFQSMPLTP